MPQSRIHNYGQTATSRWENLSLYATQRKGVYRGMGLVLDTLNNLYVSAGYAALPSTVNSVEQLVVVWESTQVGITFVAPVVPTTYTVVATHENREILGGVEVEYAVRTGEFAEVSDGVVVGWIYHTGGGASLTADMLVNAPKAMAADYAEVLTNTAPIELVAPFGTRSFLETVGPDMVVTDPSWDAVEFVIHQLAENSVTAPAQQLVRQIVQFYVREDVRPDAFQLYVKTVPDPQTYLTVEVFDTSQAPVTSVGGPFYGTGNWEWVTLLVDRTDGTFDNDKPYTLRLTHNVAVGGEIRLANIRAIFWPYPS